MFVSVEVFVGVSSVVLTMLMFVMKINVKVLRNLYEGNSSVGSVAAAAGGPTPVVVVVVGTGATGAAVVIVVEEEARAPK